MTLTHDDQAIRGWLDKWLRASAARDFENMLPMLTDDVVFLVPGQPPFGKKEFKGAWEGPMKGARVESETDIEECIVTGEVACTRTRLAVAVTTPDGKVSRAKRYTMTFFRKQSRQGLLILRWPGRISPRWLAKRDTGSQARSMASSTPRGF